MVRHYLIFLILIVLNFDLKSQNSNDTVVVKVFNDAYTILVSDDESIMAVLNGESYIEFFQLDPLKLIRTVKVTRNTWLSKAFFYENNSIFYFDYGVWAKIRYKMIDIQTGLISKVDCIDVPKGCTYRAIKLCHPDFPTLQLVKKSYIFKNIDIDIIMYQLHN